MWLFSNKHQNVMHFPLPDLDAKIAFYPHPLTKYAMTLMEKGSVTKKPAQVKIRMAKSDVLFTKILRKLCSSYKFSASEKHRSCRVDIVSGSRFLLIGLLHGHLSDFIKPLLLVLFELCNEPFTLCLYFFCATKVGISKTSMAILGKGRTDLKK